MGAKKKRKKEKGVAVEDEGRRSSTSTRNTSSFQTVSAALREAHAHNFAAPLIALAYFFRRYLFLLQPHIRTLALAAGM